MYRILIVEDEPGIAQAIAVQAKKWNLEAKCVRDFRNVMKDYSEFAPHLVLLDIALPFLMGIIGVLKFEKFPKFRSFSSLRRQTI